MKTEFKVICISFIAALATWGAAALLDHLIFYENEFLDSLILDVPSHDLYARSVLVIAILVFGAIIAVNVAKHRLAERRIERLNRVLHVIRNVNKLIVKEKSRDRLLQAIGDTLVETRGYYHAVMALLNGGETIETVITSGPDRHPCLEGGQLVCGDSIFCCCNALSQAGVQAIEDTTVTCPDCPKSGRHKERGFLAIRLEHCAKVYGLLVVSLPKKLVADEAEQSLFQEVAEDIVFGLYSIELEEERRRAEDALRQRHHQQAQLNRISQALNSSLALDQVLRTTLEELRQLLEATACSVWLRDPTTNELVCRQTSGPDKGIMQGWRLEPGEGIASWVVQFGKSLIVPDTQADDRHFSGVDQQTGLDMRSILAVPLRAKGKVIGVLQILDTAVDRFSPADLVLAESFATAGAVAIENARLYEQTDKLRAFNENIVQSMDEGIVMENVKGQIIFVNRMTVELLGYTASELRGQHYLKLLAPDQADLAREESAKRPQGIASRYEAILLSKKNRRIPVIVSARPLFDCDQFVGVLSVFTDITERKRIQEERLKFEKLESIGLLAGGIAHDFNNLLTTILGNIGVAQRYAGSDDSLLEVLTTAEKASLRARDLTRQLLTFSKGGAPVKTTASISELLRDTARFAPRGTHTSCEFQIPDDLWPVEIDEGQISQVIQNLVINADQAMPDGGTIQIIAENTTLGSDSTLPLPDGEYVKITMRDQGVGIPERLLQRVFDPYFTTKQAGSGLGLATAYSIVKGHDGYIMVESQMGVGTTFYTFLPAFTGDAMSVRAQPMNESPEKSVEPFDGGTTRLRSQVCDDTIP